MSDSPSASAQPTPLQHSSKKRLSTLLGVVASVSVLVLALWFLHRELAALSFDDIVAHARSIPTATLFGSIAFAICSYVALTGYDVTALRHINRTLPYRQTALTSFMAWAVGHNVGIATLSGGSVRYRMYSLGGLTATEIARVVVFISVTFSIGAALLLGVALLFMPATQTAALNLPQNLDTFAGLALLAIPCCYFAASTLRKEPISFRNWQMSVPQPSIALAQIAVSVADLVFAAATLYVLLAPILDIGFFSFLGLFLLAIAAGVVSSVPGGIGVFEAVIVAALPQVDTTTLLGTIIVYRLIYYIAPLILALSVLLTHEVRQHGHIIQQSTEKAGDWLSGIAPQVIGAMVFLAGVVLLISGASPAIEARLDLIARAIPLPLLELSHLAGSVVGVALLMLARGLYQRLHTAYLATLGALAIGIALSLLKGLDYEESLILGAVMLAIWFSRDEFHRVGSLATQRFSAQWTTAIVCVLCIVAWVGFVSFRQVQYSDQLWWQFAFQAEAPRILRAGVVAAMAALAFALWKLLRTGPNEPTSVTLDQDLEDVRRVLATASQASSNIALLGDKRFLWSADRQAFIMYQINGDSWIAMGDPVGPVSHQEELVWAFRQLVDRHGGRTVFYQVSEESLAHYIDLGLSLAKLGEDARVFLAGFNLQGSRRADLRQAVNRAKKHNASFEVISQPDVSGISATLRGISDHWLSEKATAEKGFSIGSFSEAYIEQFDCAVVRVENDIVAFANLWPAPGGGELSIDLMRYDERAPKGVMDYLFVELMLWGAANGYQWFSLGMAPLSGMEQHALAPLWHKLGHLIFTHGETFYNFEGLRSYKEKFDPVWSPRYLACPDGWWNLPKALLDSSILISGGMHRLLMK